MGTKKLGGGASQSKAYRLGCRALAVVLAAALTAPMTGGLQVDQALAAEGDTSAENSQPNNGTLVVNGVDFMHPEAGADAMWEVLRVDTDVDRNIYLDIKSGDDYLTQRTAFPVSNESDDTNNERVAQIIELDMKAELASTFGNPASFPVYTITAWDAQRGGVPLFEGQIYPVYAKLVGTDDSVEYKLLGIRTASKDGAAGTVGAGATYYKIDADGTRTAYVAETDAVEPAAEVENNYLVITYTQSDEEAISGAVKYVDVDGNIVRTDSIANIGDGKTVAIDDSFYTVVPVRDENGNAIEGKTEAAYYRVIDQLTGSSVELKDTAATKQVRVIRIGTSEYKPYSVKIEYVCGEGENEKVLWTDSVDVKGVNYQYTLPNVFSMSSVETLANTVTTNRDSKGWGVVQYSLAGWECSNNETGTAKDPAITFQASSDANLTVKARYTSSEQEKEAWFFVEEINGQTQEKIDILPIKVTAGGDSYTYTPMEKTINGKKFVPWSGNVNPLTFKWEDLERGVMPTERVYYVPEDYVPGDAYDVTVQYMNVANSQVVRTEQVSIDPEITDFVEIESPENFTGDDGNEYVRLDGQDQAIRHAFLSPTRTYTIYYRDVNDVLNAGITVQRTQINETQRTVLVPTTSVTTAPGETPEGDGTVDGGVTTGDGAAIINDDNNPLTTLDGQDTTTERAISDNENPLSVGAEIGSEQALDNSLLLATFLGVGVLAALGIALLLITRRRKKQEEGAQPAYAAATTDTDHADEA